MLQTHTHTHMPVLCGNVTHTCQWCALFQHDHSSTVHAQKHKQYHTHMSTSIHAHIDTYTGIYIHITQTHTWYKHTNTHMAVLCAVDKCEFKRIMLPAVERVAALKDVVSEFMDSDTEWSYLWIHELRYGMKLSLDSWAQIRNIGAFACQCICEFLSHRENTSCLQQLTVWLPCAQRWLGKVDLVRTASDMSTHQWVHLFPRFRTTPLRPGTVSVLVYHTE